ncbi:MAG: exosortase H [Ignavibacteriae bacterium]|nr:exosortase H [Ignavibacteriota bacterium]
MKKNRKDGKKTVSVQQNRIRTIRESVRKRIPQLRFLATVAVLMASYYAITGTDTFSKTFLPAYLSAVAKITGSALSLIGFSNYTSGTMVSSQAFSMSIAYGCDALEPTFLFVAVVLAFPAAWKKKVVGAISGILILYAINIIRLITLFLTGIYKREYFELMHIEIWQAIFIILALVLFVVWVSISERTSIREAV